MPRPKLTSLAALMPQKGTATRPEQVTERAIETESKLLVEIASDQASPELNKLSAADSPTTKHSTDESADGGVSEIASETASGKLGVMTSKQETPHARERSNNYANERAGERASQQPSESVSELSDLDSPTEYIDGPRSSVSFRMTERLKDRLRDYAHFSRRQKQDIMDQAVHEFLRREGY